MIKKSLSGLKIRISQGFTLIEVVLVLAIGGLIFLLAFVAFQQVSRNRRDTQRRADVNNVIAELQNYKSNTGAYPVDSGNWQSNSVFTSQFLEYYMKGADFKEPNGATYRHSNYANITATSISPDPDIGHWQMNYGRDKKCDGSNFDTASAPGSVAVRIKLENGAIYCKSTQ